MLSSNIDNKGADEPVSLKKAMAWHNWLEQKMAMKTKYNLLMKNSIWELISPLNEANVITKK